MAALPSAKPDDYTGTRQTLTREIWEANEEWQDAPTAGKCQQEGSERKEEAGTSERDDGDNDYYTGPRQTLTKEIWEDNEAWQDAPRGDEQCSAVWEDVVMASDKEEEDTKDSEDRETATIDSIMQWSMATYPELLIRRHEIEELVTEAYKYGSSVYGEQAAIDWAEGFRIPQSDVENDMRELDSYHGNLKLMVDARRALLNPERLNKERIHEFISDDNPEKEKLLLIARGMEHMADPDYRGCTFETRPKLSKSFLKAAPAVEKMFYKDFWQEGLAIILSESAVQAMPKLGLCLAGWAKKLGKPCGRPITNGSGRRTMPQEEYLNSPYATAMAKEDRVQEAGPAPVELRPAEGLPTLNVCIRRGGSSGSGANGGKLYVLPGRSIRVDRNAYGVPGHHEGSSI